MEINWLILAGVALLLFIPASWLYPAAAKDRLSSTHSARFRIERMLGTWQHWLDFGRAYAGAYFLLHAAVLFDPASAGHGEKILALILIWSVLLLAVLRQTVQHREIFYFTAPIFYIWGLTLALVEPFPAIFAIVFSAAFARLINHVELKLPLMAGLVGIAGYLLNGLTITLVLTCGLILLPLIVAFASMKHLVCYTRDLAEG